MYMKKVVCLWIASILAIASFHAYAAPVCEPNAGACSSTDGPYQTGGTIIVNGAGGQPTAYTRTSPTGNPSFTQNVLSAPYVIYMRNVAASAAAGVTGTGSNTGTNCEYGSELASGSCLFSVQSAGNTGDSRAVKSFTNRSGTWYDGSGTASCSATGWILAAGSTCTAMGAAPGTSCGGCTYAAGTGWRCTFCP